MIKKKFMKQLFIRFNKYPSTKYFLENKSDQKNKEVYVNNYFE